MNNSTPTAQVKIPLGSHPQAIALPHFATRAQAFLWRNWEMVPLENLSRVLGCSETEVLGAAAELGLRLPPQINERWIEHGYVTLIRRNWHLLPYDQLLQLLDWNAEKLDSILREDDFLWVKLGYLKPDCAPLTLEPLSGAQRAQTRALRETIERYFPSHQQTESARAFDFLDELRALPAVERRTWGRIGADEVCIDGRFSLLYPEESPNLTRWARDFAQTHAARWGVRLRAADKGDSGPRLALQIEPDANLPRESHSISVDAAGIRLSANDEVGVLRALQWLETAMDERGGPFLSVGDTQRETRLDLRLIYPFSGVHGDVLLDDYCDSLLEGLMVRLSKLGVNGLWIHGLLSQLFRWEAAPELSQGFETRLENLRRLCEQAASHGIGIYLYLNEPRGLPLRFWQAHPELEFLKGVENPEVGVASLCTSQPEVLDFLREGAHALFEAVPRLAGAFTITMSENPTNCFSSGGAESCPRCSHRQAAAVVAEVNNALAEGVWRANPGARLLAWDWGENWPCDAIELLSEGIELMSVSEENLATDVGGVAGNVLDYSISQVGPGPKARAHWGRAKSRGLKTIAKVQVNTTWECSSIPFLPVPYLVCEHLEKLETEAVSGLMLSWTVGSYPSASLDLAAAYYWKESAGYSRAGASPGELARRSFGELSGPLVEQAWRCFSAAFREFPFAIQVIYLGPQNCGPMNLLHEVSTGYGATMVCFPYDDLENWRGPYPADIFEAQWRALSDGWKEGLHSLASARQSLAPDAPTSARTRLEQIERMALGAWLHFRSTSSQVAWVRRRDELALTTGATRRAALKCELTAILDDEIESAQMMHDLVRTDSLIGYEATNHYAYTAADLREKVLNCQQLKRNLEAAPQ